MPIRAKPTVNPALIPLIQALARLAVAEEHRDTAEAASEIAELRSTLGLEADFPAWKRKAEGLMKAFYKHVSQWSRMPLKTRLRLVTTATRELGRNASYRRIAIRAAELAELELAVEPKRRRR